MKSMLGSTWVRIVAIAAIVLVAALVAFQWWGGAGRQQTFEGMVLDNGQGGGPVFCTTVMESWPPQCGDPRPVAGWDWDSVEHYDEQGQRWGEYVFDGVLGGGTITVTGPAEPRR